jgi:Rrf2 family iron-sulfur cluster assembly transcriptional regulator
MRLSTKAQYAVRAMVSLSLHGNGSPMTLKDIAGREDISLTYLEQLFVKLRRGRIVDSVRGPGGGYVLARPAQEIRVDEIIDSVEETLVPVSCMDEAGRCVCVDHCVTHNVWQGLAERIRHFLASITLNDLTKEAKEKAGSGLQSLGNKNSDGKGLPVA